MSIKQAYVFRHKATGLYAADNSTHNTRITDNLHHKCIRFLAPKSFGCTADKLEHLPLDVATYIVEHSNYKPGDWFITVVTEGDEWERLKVKLVIDESV